MALNRKGLDEIVEKGCQTPGCGCKGKPIYFNSRCHPNAEVEARYFDGILTLKCGICDEVVVEIEVAPEAMH